MVEESATVLLSAGLQPAQNSASARNLRVIVGGNGISVRRIAFGAGNAKIRARFGDRTDESDEFVRRGAPIVTRRCSSKKCQQTPREWMRRNRPIGAIELPDHRYFTVKGVDGCT
jgi:hypothetical protein